TTFTANVSTGGGQQPTFQWQLNGQDVFGATQGIWSTAGLAPYDRVNCMVTSSDPCANPTTASSDTVTVNFPSGVDEVDNSKGLHLYPNPNTGSFTIESESSIQSIEVLSSTGQKVYSSKTEAKKLEVNLPASLANGVYVLRVETDKEV